MALGSIDRCWLSWELEYYKNSDLKQICTPVRGKKYTICEGMIIWLCPKCRKELKHDTK